MGLSWLSPLYLAGAAAAIVPIVLHLFFRRRTPIVNFAAMRYLSSAPIEPARRRRLKEWLLLALRVAGLLLLATAFARPFVAQGATGDGGGTVILLDTSASLTAPGQFERARAAALDALDDVPTLGRVAVVSMGGPSVVLSELSADHRLARVALQQARPGAGATRYADALARGADLLDGQGQLLVVTDMQASGWDVSGASMVPESVRVVVREVDGPRANVSIEALRRDGRDIVAVVHNHSPASATQVVEFASERRSLGQVSVTVPAFAIGEARLPIGAEEAGRLTATVDDATGYVIDNSRHIVLSAARPARVAVVTAFAGPSEGLYVRRALEAAEGSARVDVRVLSALQVSTPAADSLGEVDVVVIVATRGLDQRGRQQIAGFVRRGGGLLVAAGPDVDPSFIRDALGTLLTTSVRERQSDQVLTFAPQDMRHPIFGRLGGFGTLAHAEFTHAASLEGAAPSDVLAKFSDGTAAMVEERAGVAGDVDEGAGGGTVLLFASDLNAAWNTLPLQPAFAPLLVEAVTYLAERRASRGEYYAGELNQPGADVPGVVTLAGNPVRSVAINIDPRESDPARTSVDAFRTAVSPLRTRAAARDVEDARGSERAQRLWRYGLAAMLILVVAEGALGRRMG